MLDNLVAGGQPGLGQLHGGDAVAPGQAGVQRLGHGAEVVDQARGHRPGDAQRGYRLLLVQVQQLGAGGGAGQASDDGGAVEAPVHLLVLGGVLQRQAHLAADDVGLQQIASGGPALLADGQQGREDGDRRVAEAAEVIVVQRVAHGAVGEGSVGQGALRPAGKHRGLRHGALVGDVFLDNLAHWLHRPGQDHAQ